MFSDGGSVRRHDLIWLTSAGRDHLFEENGQLSAIPGTTLWRTRDYPLIVRRDAKGDRADRFPAALALPPAQGKLRIAVQIRPDDIDSMTPPPSLAFARGNLPASWQETIEKILMIGVRCGVTPQIYGAAMWQALTGQSYVTAHSDLDLIWNVDGCVARFADLLLSMLPDVCERAPMAIDGEIVRADGMAANWLETVSADDNALILLRKMQGASMMPRAVFLSGKAPP